MPLSFPGGQTALDGAHALVCIRVGNGPLVPVILDSGSVGLHINQQAVGSDVTSTGQSFCYPYTGHYQSGVYADANVTIGGLTTPKIPIGEVTGVGSGECPPTRTPSPPPTGQSMGVLGVRVEDVGSPGIPPNPLMELPAPYSRSWSIGLSGSGGQLVLGAQAPRNPRAWMPLTVTGNNPPVARLCWTVGHQHACERTLFDSGDPAQEIYGGALSRAPTTMPPGGASPALVNGTPVTTAVSRSSLPFMSFTAGSVTSKNMVHVNPPGQSGATVNTGVRAFFANTVTFDAVPPPMVTTAAPASTSLGLSVVENPGIIVFCPAGRARCREQETATVPVHGSARRLVIGYVRTTLAPGTSRALTFSLNQQGLAWIRPTRSLRARITTVSRAGNHRSVIATKTITISALAAGSDFALSQLKAHAKGSVSFQVTVPGPGAVQVMETARKSSLARVAVARLQPAPGRFVFARADQAVRGNRPLHFDVRPNPRGRGLVAHHRGRLSLRLWVTWIPAAGSPHSIGIYNLRLPTP